MRENTLKTRWRNNQWTLNGWCAIPSPWSAELMANQGWDSVTVDLQHGLIHYETAVQMFQAISTTNAFPLARIPWLEAGIIGKLLDAGAYGIICPMVNTRADCEAFVGACRYPPMGYRSYGPVRASVYAGDDYFERANDTITTFAMIETAQALDNLDEILSVPGLDAIFVGPADMNISLAGTPKFNFAAPPLSDALKKIVEGCQRHNVVPGIHCNSNDMVHAMRALGFQFITLLSDGVFMTNAASAAVKAARGEAVATPSPTSQRSY